jgi:hypothetical protein
LFFPPEADDPPKTKEARDAAEKAEAKETEEAKEVAAKLPDPPKDDPAKSK